ncbi:MAG: nickel pincer cofactor biosynthesis protein LarC [Methanocellales archaeon]
MKAAVFEPFCGASGDMIIAALLDLGADREKVKNAMESIAGVSVQLEKVVKRGISATKVAVLSERKIVRYLEMIEEIKNSQLDEAVISDALAIFDILASAEAKIHNVAKQDLHFHEIGAADAIADVIGACVAYRDLNLDKCKVYCLPISVGGGIVKTFHGSLPVPAPATLEILQGYNLKFKGGPVEAELLTPTGAAILAYLTDICEDFYPQFKVEKVGYGAGHADFEVSNVLRIAIGEIDEALIRDEVEVLETNVDDTTGQILGNLIEELLTAGALDVAIIPAVMKKGRSGHVIQVIAKPSDSSRLARKMIEETGSLGIRYIPVHHRLIANREIKKIEVDFGVVKQELRVKIARDLNGRILNIAAEFEDAKKLSRSLGIPIREVLKKAEETARKQFINL